MLLPVTHDPASEISHDTASVISLGGRGLDPQAARAKRRRS